MPRDSGASLRVPAAPNPRCEACVPAPRPAAGWAAVFRCLTSRSGYREGGEPRRLARGWWEWRTGGLVLVVVFFVGVTPVALIARIVGKRFLALGFEPERSSYWERRKKPERGRERYESQF